MTMMVRMMANVLMRSTLAKAAALESTTWKMIESGTVVGLQPWREPNHHRRHQEKCPAGTRCMPLVIDTAEEEPGTTSTTTILLTCTGRCPPSASIIITLKSTRTLRRRGGGTTMRGARLPTPRSEIPGPPYTTISIISTGLLLSLLVPRRP
jgi:hypothetical protein